MAYLVEHKNKKTGDGNTPKLNPPAHHRKKEKHALGRKKTGIGEVLSIILRPPSQLQRRKLLPPPYWLFFQQP